MRGREQMRAIFANLFKKAGYKARKLVRYLPPKLQAKYRKDAVHQIGTWITTVPNANVKATVRGNWNRFSPYDQNIKVGTALEEQEQVARRTVSHLPKSHVEVALKGNNQKLSPTLTRKAIAVGTINARKIGKWMVGAAARETNKSPKELYRKILRDKEVKPFSDAFRSLWPTMQILSGKNPVAGMQNLDSIKVVDSGKLKSIKYIGVMNPSGSRTNIEIIGPKVKSDLITNAPIGSLGKDGKVSKAFSKRLRRAIDSDSAQLKYTKELIKATSEIRGDKLPKTNTTIELPKLASTSDYIRNMTGSVATHEFGHALDNIATGSRLSKALRRRHPLTMVSEYGNANASEFLAETYAAYATPAGRRHLMRENPELYKNMKEVFEAQTPEAMHKLINRLNREINTRRAIAGAAVGTGVAGAVAYKKKRNKK